jgi:hypothetical protein
VADGREQHHPGLAAGIERHHVALEKAEVGIVGRDRTQVRIPHDLDCNVGIVGIEQRERLPRDVAQ